LKIVAAPLILGHHYRFHHDQRLAVAGLDGEGLGGGHLHRLNQLLYLHQLKAWGLVIEAVSSVGDNPDAEGQEEVCLP
jgi:hypothetical protein